jgi:NitT/TauT family transport system substrate-binding protein
MNRVSALRPRGPWRSVAVLVALAALVASCGSNDDGRTASTAGAATAAPKNVTVMLGGHAMSWSPAYVADKLGYFEQEGVKVNIVASPEGAPYAVAAVMNGSVLMSFHGSSSGVGPIGQGAPARFAMVSALKVGPDLIGSEKWMQAKGITPNSSTEDKVKALKGSKLGVFNTGDTLEQQYKYLFAKYDLGPVTGGGATIVPLSNIAGELAALKQGKVDVIASSPPGGQQAEAQGIGKIFFTAGDDPDLANYPNSIGFAKADSLTGENKDAVQALIRGFYRGILALKNEPDKAKPVIRAQFSQLSDADFEIAFKEELGRLPESPVITEKQWESFINFRKTIGEDTGKLAFTSYVSSDLAKEAVAEVDKKMK